MFSNNIGNKAKTSSWICVTEWEYVCVCVCASVHTLCFQQSCQGNSLEKKFFSELWVEGLDIHTEQEIINLAFTLHHMYKWTKTDHGPPYKSLTCKSSRRKHWRKSWWLQNKHYYYSFLDRIHFKKYNLEFIKFFLNVTSLTGTYL